MMPKISVIVPNYNHARFLKQRLDSIFNQTFQDFEVILLDDCSTDNSVEILSEYAKNRKVSHFIINEKNSGSTFKQWKKGIDLAKGEYIWIAESDDWADERFLEILIKQICKNNNIALAFCRTYRVNEKGDNLGINRWGEHINPQRWNSDFINQGNDEIENYLINRNTLPNASAIIFKKVKGVKVIDNIINYRFCGDWLFWMLIINNAQIAYNSEILNYFRRYQNATSLKKESKIIIRRVSEYNKIINFAKSKIIQNNNKFDHQWIIDEWFSSKDRLKLLSFLLPPFYRNLKIAFYKQLLKKHL